MSGRLLHKRTPAQLQASDPHAHVWVSASAGTGKTQVLTDRMLRLMLAGSAPDRILALTFTRAAAAEMQNRLTRRLGQWVGLADADLAAELAILDVPPRPENLARARALFAESLEVPGGLKVQTLHGFAQGLLAGFPIEAGLPPGFTALDERATAQLQARALAEVVAEAADSGDTGFLDDLAELAVERGEGNVRQALKAMLAHADGIAAFSTPDAVEPAIRRYLNLPDGETAESLVRQLVAPGTHDDARLAAFADAMAAWNTATGNAMAETARAWLTGDAATRQQNLGILRSLVLTTDDTPKKHVSAVKKFPHLQAIIEDIAADLLLLEARQRSFELAVHAARHVRAGLRYTAHYARLKRAEVAIDYDDMIAVAMRLLGSPGMPAWVGWKLDQRFDHILVDEAQDTNARQWSIIRKLAEEYFDGTGSRGNRSLFVVGDYKQAIYGFQGTDPRLFEAQRDQLGGHAEAVGTPLHTIPLDRSFRSGPAVLEVVDAVLADIGHEALGMAEASAPHLPNRHDAPGEVVVWPLLVAGSDDEVEEEADGEGAQPVGEEQAERLMARTLARQIAGWLTVGHAERLWLAAQRRWAHAGDILILVRKRSRLMTALVANLHEEGVPVAGVDRLLLTEPYAVLDLISLMRFAVQPEDDLRLAELLVSPFLGWEHEQVRAIAAGRRHSLWRALREAVAGDPHVEEAYAFLSRILAMADMSTPYVFLDTVLSGELQGRRKLVARLGEDATQPIDELLAQALGFEARNHPSLEAFLAWIEADGSEVKRDPDAASAEVRLMTIHGAKGLEAPVVILADAAHGRKASQSRNVPVRLVGSTTEIPLFFPSAKYLSGEAKKIYEERELAERQEDLRLLYVGLTRAADHLFIGGAVTRRTARAMEKEAMPRWWSRLYRVASALPGAEECPVPLWHAEQPAIRIARGDWSAGPAADIRPADGGHPHWAGLALSPAPPPTRPMRPLTPSALDSGPAEGPATAERRQRAERGRLIHSLFQHLPAVEPARRAAAARNWLLARRAGEQADDIVATVLQVLDDPALADLFGPDALAEAPIAGLIGEQMITGTVDRLLIGETRIRLVDYKTGLSVPADAAGVHMGYVRQMAAYHAVLGRAFPGRAIEAALIFTSGPKLILLPDALLAAHKPG